MLPEDLELNEEECKLLKFAFIYTISLAILGFLVCLVLTSYK